MRRGAIASIAVRPAAGVEVREVADGLNVDLDAAGNVVSFDIACNVVAAPDVTPILTAAETAAPLVGTARRR